MLFFTHIKAVVLVLAHVRDCTCQSEKTGTDFTTFLSTLKMFVKFTS